MEEEKKQDTLDLIRRTAFVQILENGYEGMNLRKLSEDIGMKASSLYFYYSSKKEMFADIYGEIFRSQKKEMMEIMEINKELLPREQLYLIFRSRIRSCIYNSASYRFILRFRMFPPREIAEIARVVYERSFMEELEYLTPLLKEALPEAALCHAKDLELFYLQFCSTQNSIIYEMLLSGLTVSEKSIQLHWDKFWESSFATEK